MRPLARASRAAPAVLALALLCGLAAGCGDGTDEAGSRGEPDPASASPSVPSSAPSPSRPAASVTAETDAAGLPSVVRLVSATAAGGEVTTTPTPVDDPAARSRYLTRLGRGLATDLGRAIRQEAAGPGSLTATVVAVGCVPPRSVDVTRGGGGWRVRAVPAKAEGEVQCFAPVTTVALVRLPDRPA